MPTYESSKGDYVGWSDSYQSFGQITYVNTIYALVRLIDSDEPGYVVVNLNDLKLANEERIALYVLSNI